MCSLDNVLGVLAVLLGSQQYVWGLGRGTFFWALGNVSGALEITLAMCLGSWENVESQDSALSFWVCAWGPLSTIRVMWFYPVPWIFFWDGSQSGILVFSPGSQSWVLRECLDYFIMCLGSLKRELNPVRILGPQSMLGDPEIVSEVLRERIWSWEYIWSPKMCLDLRKFASGCGSVSGVPTVLGICIVSCKYVSRHES